MHRSYSYAGASSARALAIGTALALSCVAACTAERAGAPAISPASDLESQRGETTDLDAIERELALDEQRLNASLPLEEPPAGKPGDTQTPVHAESEVTVTSEAGAAGADYDEEPRAAPQAAPTPARAEPERSVATDPCDVACRALESMARAAGRLCDITGETAPRCRAARERVRSATSRVAASRCECGSD
ncbi:MAG TPA: hypothetical protein VF989_04600 [Polyangiaceae bacterium]